MISRLIRSTVFQYLKKHREFRFIHFNFANLQNQVQVQKLPGEMNCEMLDTF